MASITSRPRLDGTTSFMVRWRDPETRRQHGLTFRSQDEASELMLELHIQGTIGAIAVDAFGYRDIMRWVQSLLRKGLPPRRFITCTACCQQP